MDDDEFNAQLRKFLREVGVTSQQRIEEAVASGAVNGKSVRLRMHLTSEPDGLDHVVERTIDLPDRS